MLESVPEDKGNATPINSRDRGQMWLHNNNDNNNKWDGNASQRLDQSNLIGRVDSVNYVN